VCKAEGGKGTVKIRERTETEEKKRKGRLADRCDRLDSCEWASVWWCVRRDGRKVKSRQATKRPNIREAGGVLSVWMGLWQLLTMLLYLLAERTRAGKS